jgi:DNA-directed RNA polymerase specialized sigma24 family protein
MDPFVDTDERDGLIRAIRRLSPTQRATLVLRYYDGLSEAPTTQLLGLPLDAVRSARSRSLLGLREALGPASGHAGVWSRTWVR